LSRILSFASAATATATATVTATAATPKALLVVDILFDKVIGQYLP
jgi:hypothetical protein